MGSRHSGGACERSKKSGGERREEEERSFGQVHIHSQVVANVQRHRQYVDDAATSATLRLLPGLRSERARHLLPSNLQLQNKPKKPFCC